MTAGQWFGVALMTLFIVPTFAFLILSWAMDIADNRKRRQFREELADISREFDALGPNPSLEEMRPALDRLAAYRIRFANWRSPIRNST